MTAAESVRRIDQSAVRNDGGKPAGSIDTVGSLGCRVNEYRDTSTGARLTRSRLGHKCEIIRYESMICVISCALISGRNDWSPCSFGLLTFRLTPGVYLYSCLALFRWRADSKIHRRMRAADWYICTKIQSRLKQSWRDGVTVIALIDNRPANRALLPGSSPLSPICSIPVLCAADQFHRGSPKRDGPRPGGPKRQTFVARLV